jgi:methylamine utilization protein MauE
MVQTIAPVVHGRNRRTWVRMVVLHVLGGAISAAAVGAVLGATGALLGAPWGPWGALPLAAAAVAYASRDLVGLPVPIPEARRQVPEWWRSYFPPGPAAFLYGLGLGVGFLTHLRHGTLVVVALAAAASGDPAVGAVVIVPFGVARSIAVALAWVRGRHHGGRVADRLERIGEGRGPAVVNGAVLVVLAATAVAARPAGGPAGAVSIAPLILAGVMGWAATSKVLRPSRWRRSLAIHGLPRPLELGAAVAVPAVEAGAAVLLVTGRVAGGAMLSLGLLAAFTVALVRVRRRVGSRVPCGCFGSSETRDVRLLLARNAGLALMAGTALATAGRTSSPAVPHGSDLLPALLAVVGAFLGAWAVLRVRSEARSPRRYPTG